MTSTPQPTDGLPEGRTYAVGYDATDHGQCTRCGTPCGPVFALIDDKDTCVACLRLTDWWAEAQFIDILTDLDATVASGDHDQTLMRAELAMQVLAHIEEARLPGGIDAPMPKRLFIREIVRRRPADWSQEQMFQTLKGLVPDLSREDVDQLAADAEERAARGISQATGMGVALALLRAAGAGPGSPMTIGEAVDQLDIDYQMFHGTVLTAAAELGVAPQDVPDNVLADLVAGAKKTEETS